MTGHQRMTGHLGIVEANHSQTSGHSEMAGPEITITIDATRAVAADSAFTDLID